MLEYKGYVGEVVYDDEAEVLHARVINSGPYPIANAEATDVEGHQAGVPRPPLTCTSTGAPNLA